MADKPSKKLKRLQNQGDVVRVLYVEDAAVIRDTISRLLKLSGYQVAYAKNGEEGVQKAKSWKPDVVLMDLRMPVMDGYQAIDEIKSDPELSHIPVFVITAWSNKKERTQAKLVGADQFFVKPPDLDQLIAAIENAVHGSR
jgi:CheY-like chemotaxis protein